MTKHKDKITLADLIEEKTGHKVLPLTVGIEGELTPLVLQAIANYNAGPKFPGRVNEFGNHMETVLRNTDLTKFSKPTKLNGKKKSAGYPDLKFISSNGTIVYPEVKVYKQGSEGGQMRSFYISSFDKVTTDAVHVVIGFEHVDKVLTSKYHIVDTGNVTLEVKMEYACNNKELYSNAQNI